MNAHTLQLPVCQAMALGKYTTNLTGSSI